MGVLRLAPIVKFRDVAGPAFLSPCWRESGPPDKFPGQNTRNWRQPLPIRSAQHPPSHAAGNKRDGAQNQEQKTLGWRQRQTVA